MTRKKIFIVSIIMVYMFLFITPVVALQQWTYYSRNNGNLLDDQVHHITKISDGTMVLGTNGGGITTAKDGKFNTILTDQRQLSNNFIKALHIDNSDQMWIGTNLGLDRLNSEGNWQHFNKNNSGLLADEITAIATDNDGGVWVGVSQRGASYKDQDNNWKHYNASITGLSSNDIRDIAVDKDGGVWFATYGMIVSQATSYIGGVGYLKPNGEWVNYTQRNSSLPSDRVNAITTDNKGGKWIATQGGVAYLDSEGKWKVYTQNNSKLPENAVRDIAIDEVGNPWFATWGGGLAHINTSGEWEVMRNHHIITGANYLHAVEVDGDGNVWVGTNIGAFKYQRQQPKPPIQLDVNKIQVVYNNKLVDFDVDPFIENGTTFVPLRALSETMGFTPRWEGETRRVFIEGLGTNIILTIDKKEVTHNGKTIELFAPPRIVGSRTLVPVRFISESLGKEVKWDRETRTVYVYDK